MKVVKKIIERFLWMFKVKDCWHICIFCKYYHNCIAEGATERRKEK